MHILTTVITAHLLLLTTAQYFYATDAPSASKTGPWAVQPSFESFSGYLAANITGGNDNNDNGNISITFDTSPITQNGNYSVNIYTPGCLQEDNCNQRGTVSIVGQYVSETASGGGASGAAATATSIAQTNDYDKYDQIYMGGVNASEGGFKTNVKLEAVPGQGTVVVAQAIRFELLEAFGSSGNSTSTGTINASQTGTAGTSSTVPSIPNVTVTASANSHSKGLDSGAKIGIGVGVSLGVLLCLIVGLLVYLGIVRRRKAAAKEGSSQGDGNEEEDESKAQLHGESSRTEMVDTSAQAELPQGKSHAELKGVSSPVELPGKFVGQELAGGVLRDTDT